MSLDLDPTEQQLAAALARLAAAYVPEAGDPPVPLPARRHDLHRRWLALAVAASLIALVAGIWAVAGRGDDPVPVTVPPTPAPPPSTSSPAPMIDPADGVFAVIDPAVATGQPTVAGAVDRHLGRADQWQVVGYVRRGPDGSIESAIGVAIGGGPSGFDQGTLTIAGRQALRLASGSSDLVTYRIDLDGLVLSADVPLVFEDLTVRWLEESLAGSDDQVDLSVIPPPDGFEALPTRIRSASVSYPEGDSIVMVETMYFTTSVSVADWVAFQTPGVPFDTVGDLTTVDRGGAATYLLWQPAPTVLVSVTADVDPTEWGRSLVLSSDTDVSVTEADTWMSFEGQTTIDESALDRIVLGEAALGRFAYVEQRSAERGVCWAWAFEQLGGSSSCTDPSSVTSSQITEAGAPDLTCFSSTDTTTTRTVGNGARPSGRRDRLLA